MERDRIVALLYRLMRDELPAGVLAELVEDLEGHPPPYAYTNEHLAAYARELAERLS